LAEEERFELSRQIAPTYSFSKAAPSATWVLLLVAIHFKLPFCQRQKLQLSVIAPLGETNRPAAFGLFRRKKTKNVYETEVILL
jgi:hypothetical protein